MTERRKPITTPSGRAVIAAGISRDLSPPFKINKQEKEIYESILKRRAKAMWELDDLYIVTHLARCIYRINNEFDLLKTEGSIDPETGKANPRVSIIKTLSSELVGLRRTLGLQAGAGMHKTGNESKNERVRQKHAQQMEQQMTADGIDMKKMSLIKQFDA